MCRRCMPRSMVGSTRLSGNSVMVLQWGLAGAPVTTALVYAAITLLPLSLVLPAMLRGMQRRHIGATVPAAS